MQNSIVSSTINRFLRVVPFNLLVWALLILYLLPVLSIIVTGMMPTEQLGDTNAPLYPARIKRYTYQGKEYQVYKVPMNDGVKQLAMIEPGALSSLFVDPQDSQTEVIEWTGDWNTLIGVYEFHPTWRNFTVMATSLPFGTMLRNTFLLTLVGEIAVLASSILVAYGFARYKIPGGNLLFYIMIATILIPEKITFIPTFYVYVAILKWNGTVLPVLLHLFFGNAVYIFLLRQNFKGLPIDLEEAAMLDGAGPLRRLFYVILPQSWPVVITVSLLHFFYTWNETRLASIYFGTNPELMPISFGVQNYQSLVPIDNIIQASTVVMLIVPVAVLFLAQKYFMQGLVITGAEK
ncbi:MAG: carbohydrate ABC transporter permease [Anaerolineales bacterium]|nr:carbohydrate ABC transporter permease [Anaerolineales bacterium]